MAASLFVQAAFLVGLSIAAGTVRSFFPNNIDWKGRWPTADTSTEDAYRMVAKEDDPAFVSLTQAVAMHGAGGVFVDARSTEEFKEGHIPGARNLPFYELDAHIQSALKDVQPNDRLVIYCEGVGCELSLFLGRELAARGFSDLNIFYGGYPEWTNAGLAVDK